MRQLTDTMTIGRRVAFYRRRKGLSQEVFSGLVGRTTEWLRKIETGRAELDRLSVIRSLAEALDISVGELVDEPTAPQRQPGPDPLTVPAIRAALRDYRYLSPTMAADQTWHPLTLTDLEQAVAHLWTTYQHSQYRRLARLLPDLIEKSLATVQVHDGDKRRQAGIQAAYVIT